MTTLTVTPKSTALAKTTAPVRELANRLERARQARNEKVARADADYVDAVKRALSALEDVNKDQIEPTDVAATTTP